MRNVQERTLYRGASWSVRLECTAWRALVPQALLTPSTDSQENEAQDTPWFVVRQLALRQENRDNCMNQMDIGPPSRTAPDIQPSTEVRRTALPGGSILNATACRRASVEQSA